MTAWYWCSECGNHSPWPHNHTPRPASPPAGAEANAALRDALRIHHPIMRSETGPFSGCRCGQVQLGQDVIAHVVAHLRAALDG
jgi:hypothetical protein